MKFYQEFALKGMNIGKSIAIALALLLLSSGRVFAESYPSKPLKLIVYTNPGGLIDISARKIAQVLEKNLVEEPVVVENKKGAGGLVAIQHVLRQPADGHTVLALTSSVVSKAVESRQEDKLDQLEMLVRLVDDYECLVVKEGGKFDSLAALTAAVKDPNGRSIWAGPEVGGTDHLFALKYWKAVGGKGVWIPYKSGGEALAALLGGHADVYVGNPQDVKGRSGLKILAVASPERISQFGQVPTFLELSADEPGLKQLTGESLWRGLAVRKGTPDGVKQQLSALLQKMVDTDSWKSFITEGGATSVFETGAKFQNFVAAQADADRDLLKELKADKS